MKTTLLLAVAMMAGTVTYAQPSFTLTTYLSDYNELTDATIMADYDVDEDTWDDPIFFVPFGFDFQIDDETYNTSFQLGPGALMAFGNPFDPSDTLYDVFGLTDDVIDGDFIEDLSSSEISYSTVGEPGNRIAKIQYKNAAFYDEVAGSEPSADNRINFQLWFYENGGIMEIHFGNSNIPNPEIAFYGNPGPTVVLGINIGIDSSELEYGATIIGDPANPTLFEFTTIPDEGTQTGLNGVPETARVYRLDPSGTSGVFDKSAPEFSLYPTVATSTIWIKGTINTHAKYRIFDITGKELQTGKLQGETGINVSSLGSGIYLFSIDGMGNAAKFIKK